MKAKSRNHKDLPDRGVHTTSEALNRDLNKVSSAFIKPSQLLQYQTPTVHQPPDYFTDNKQSNNQGYSSAFERRGRSLATINTDPLRQMQGHASQSQTDRREPSIELPHQLKPNTNRNGRLNLSKFQHGTIRIQSDKNSKNNGLINQSQSKLSLPAINPLMNANAGSHERDYTERKEGYMKFNLRPSNHAQKLNQQRQLPKKYSQIRIPIENKIIKPKTYEKIFTEKVRQFGKAAIIQQLSAAVVNSQNNGEYTGQQKRLNLAGGLREADWQEKTEREAGPEDDGLKLKYKTIENEVRNMSKLLSGNHSNNESPRRGKQPIASTIRSKQVQPLWENNYQGLFEGTPTDIYQTLNLNKSEGLDVGSKPKILQYKNKSLRRKSRRTGKETQEASQRVPNEDLRRKESILRNHDDQRELFEIYYSTRKQPQQGNQQSQKKSSFDVDPSIKLLDSVSQEQPSNSRNAEQKETSNTASGLVPSKSLPETNAQYQDSVMQPTQNDQVNQRARRQHFFQQERGESHSFQNKLQSGLIINNTPVKPRRSILVQPMSLDRLAHQHNMARLQNQAPNQPMTLSLSQPEQTLSKKPSPETKKSRDEARDQETIPEASLEHFTPRQEETEEEKKMIQNKIKQYQTHQQKHVNYSTVEDAAVLNKKKATSPRKLDTYPQSPTRSRASNSKNVKHAQNSDRAVRESKKLNRRSNSKSKSRNKGENTTRASRSGSPLKSLKPSENQQLTSLEIRDFFSTMDGFEDGFRSLSELTKGYNDRGKNLIARMDQKMSPHREGGQENEQEGMVAAERTNTNFRMIKYTSKQMKQIIHQANQLLCKKDEFHKLIQLDKRKVEATPGVPLIVQKDKLLLSTFDLCKSSKLFFKIKVKGEPSPLKLKFEYFDASVQQVLHASQLHQFRGFIDVFVSKSTDNPHHVLPQIADAQNNCEKYYNNQVPPLNISLASNPQNIAGVPFVNEFAYLTIIIGDLDRLDDLQVTIRATTSNASIRGKTDPQGAGHSDKANQNEKDDDSLNDYLVQERQKEFQKPRNQKHNLLTFKKEVEKQMDILLHDQQEWKVYQEEMQERIRRRYFNHTQEGRPIFLTQDDEFMDYDLDMLQYKIYLRNTSESEQVDLDMLEQRRHTQKLYEMQKKCESEGNFISLNMIQIKNGQHDQIAKLRKQIGLSLINNRKQQITQRNEDNEVERRKRMVFLQHRKKILSQIRDQATTAAYLRRERHRRVRKWIQLLDVQRVCKVAFANYSARKAKIEHEKWKVKSIRKIRKRFDYSINRWGADRKQRYRNQARFVNTILGRTLAHLARNKPRDIIEDFLRVKAEEEAFKKKFRQYYLVVASMILKKKESNTVDHARKQALFKQLVLSKQLVLQELFRQNAKQQKANKQQKPQDGAAAPKSKDNVEELIQKYMNLKDEPTVRPLVHAWYAARQLRNTIIDRYAIAGLAAQAVAQIDKQLKKQKSESAQRSEHNEGEKIAENQTDGGSGLQSRNEQADDNELMQQKEKSSEVSQNERANDQDDNFADFSMASLSEQERRQLEKEKRLLQAKQTSYINNMPHLLERYERLLLQVGLLKAKVLKVEALSAKQVADQKKKQKSKKNAEAVSCEAQAEKLDLPQLSQMKESKVYVRPGFLSWAPTSAQARQILQRAIKIEEQQQADQDDAIERENQVLGELDAFERGRQPEDEAEKDQFVKEGKRQRSNTITKKTR